MRIIYTSCPITGREISTGVEADAESFALMPDTIARIACPHCGQQHNWSKHNAFLRDRPEPPTP